MEVVKEKDNEILSLTDQVQDMKKVLIKVRNERDENIQKLEEYANTDEEVRKRERHISELASRIEELEGQLSAPRRDGDHKTDSPGARADTKHSIIITQGDEALKKSTVDPLITSDYNFKIRMLEDENSRLKAKLPVPGEKTRKEVELEKECAYLHNLLKNLAKDDYIHRPTYNSVEYPSRTGGFASSQTNVYGSSNLAKSIINPQVNDYSVVLPQKIESPLKSQKEIDSLISTVF